MRRFTLSPKARADLDDIADYISEDNPARAGSFVTELEERATAAAERPFSFRAREDIGQGIRSIVHGRYLILFRVTDEEVVILRFYHSARHLRLIHRE